MEFHKIEHLSALWKDFSSLTPFEECAAAVSRAVEAAAGAAEEAVVCRIGDSKLSFFPSGADTQQIFGFDSAFFMLNADSEEESRVGEMLSVLACAFSAAKCELPFFVYTNGQTRGLRLSAGGRTAYSAKWVEGGAAECADPSAVLSDMLERIGCADAVCSAQTEFEVLSQFPLVIRCVWEPSQGLRELHFDGATRCTVALANSDEYECARISSALQCAAADAADSGRGIDFAPFRENESALRVLTDGIGSGDIGCLWQSFVQWMEHCFRANTAVGIDERLSGERARPLLYQKLQAFNYYVSKKKNRIRTSDYILTADQYDSIDEIIRKSVVSCDNMDMITKIRDRVIQYKAERISKEKKQYVQDIEKRFRGKGVSKADIKSVFDSVSDNLFDPEQQCQLAMDYISTLTKHEYLSQLLIILFLEEIYDMKESIKFSEAHISKEIEEIQSDLMSVQKQLSSLRYNEFLSKLDAISLKINKLQNNIAMVNYYTESGLDSSLIELLPPCTGKNVFTDATAKTNAKELLSALSELYRCTQVINITINYSVAPKGSGTDIRFFASVSENSDLTISSAIQEHEP